MTNPLQPDGSSKNEPTGDSALQSCQTWCLSSIAWQDTNATRVARHVERVKTSHTSRLNHMFFVGRVVREIGDSMRPGSCKVESAPHVTIDVIIAAKKVHC